MDIIIRDVEEKDGQYKIYNKDGTGGHWYISKESAEQISGQIEPRVSLRLRHKYSGDDSKLFWKLVNAMGERQQEFYSLGVVLQNLESWILTQMKYEAPNFVEDEQASK